MPGTNLILAAAGNWTIEKFMVNRISRGGEPPFPGRRYRGENISFIFLLFRCSIAANIVKTFILSRKRNKIRSPDNFSNIFQKKSINRRILFSKTNLVSIRRFFDAISRLISNDRVIKIWGKRQIERLSNRRRNVEEEETKVFPDSSENLSSFFRRGEDTRSLIRLRFSSRVFLQIRHSLSRSTKRGKKRATREMQTEEKIGSVRTLIGWVKEKEKRKANRSFQHLSSPSLGEVFRPSINSSEIIFFFFCANSCVQK